MAKSYDIGLMAENYSTEMMSKNDTVTHDSLISNLNGTYPSEVFLMTFVVPTSSLCWSLLPTIPLPFMGQYGRMLIKAIFLHFIFLFALTVWSDYVVTILLSIHAIIVTTVFMVHKLWESISPLMKDYVVEKPKNTQRFSFWKMVVKNEGHHVAFLANYRGHMLLATAITILAVDFPIFPRRFAKTENYGWSIMDAGVGCFVAVHGICSPYSRKITERSSLSISKSVKSSLPLLVLGFIRLAAVKAVNYHEHVSEYGVHWNFFFTLAITKMLCSAILTACHSKVRSGILAMFFLVLHQYLLSAMGISEFVLSESRENLLQANKEGISSILGFVAIYFMGTEIGSFIWRPRHTMQEWLHALVALLVIGGIGWSSMYGFHLFIQPTSRKMTNLPYCIWIIALTSMQLAVHLTEQLLSALHQSESGNLVKKSTPYAVMESFTLWKAVNENGLAYFLLANILTGLVNIAMDTTNVSTELTLFILSTYILILMSVILILSKFSVCLKFW